MFEVGDLIFSTQNFAVFDERPITDFHPEITSVMSRVMIDLSMMKPIRKSYYLVADKISYEQSMIFSLTTRAKEVYLLYDYCREQFVKCKTMHWFKTVDILDL